MVLPTSQSSSNRRNRDKSKHSSASRTFLLTGTVICLPLLICGWVWFTILTQGQLAIAGVPTPIIISFLLDETARDAYFDGNKQKLHDRLQEMGVEEQIKAFYRPQFQNDEVKLDQYIHQLLYERTGYVGKAYRVNSKGILVLKKRVYSRSGFNPDF